jgi:transcriptional regulator with XRE-family HTH domain
MEIDKLALGNRIKTIRLEKSMNLKEFGFYIDNTSDSIVSRWEKGKSIPNAKRLKLIANAGGISVNELLYGSLENFRYSVINELFELNFIQSGLKENNPDLYYYLGGEDFRSVVYDSIDKQNLGYEDEEKIHEIFRKTYNLKLSGYANRKSEINYLIHNARRELNLNLILEYFDRKANHNEYQRKQNAGEFVSPNLLKEEKPVDIHLDDIKLSDDEVKQLQNIISKIQKNRNKK